jgi:acyl-CoA thioesterase-1
MIKLCLNSHTQVLLVGMRLPPNYGEAYTEKFSSIYTQLATEFKIALVPFLLLNVATKPSLMQADRIHPTAEGQPLLLENVWIHLNPLIQ